MSTRPYDAAIVGAGSFGTALALVLARQNRSVCVWARRSEQAREINEARTNGKYLASGTLPACVYATSDPQEAIQNTRTVLFAMPSKGLRAVAREMGELIQGDQIVVHATKGIELDGFKRMSQVLREETCALKIGVLSGPNLASELIAGQPSGAVIASRFDEVVSVIQDLFAGASLRVYGGRDVTGVEIGGAFKNIIAIAAGVADGLGFGDNTKSLLITRGLTEMASLGVRLGADVFTFGGLAGIGDLMATCGSPLSRNHQVGELLAKGLTLDAVLAKIPYVAEGIPSTRAVHAQLPLLGIRLPITSAVHRLLFDAQPAADAVRDLMALPVGTELSALRY